MAIIQNYLTRNPCYTANKSIKVQGLMLHSVGVPQPKPSVFVKSWNSESAPSACVHGFIGEDDIYITLPCLEKSGSAHRGWHAGKGSKGSANDTHIGIEMCEPNTIKYTSGATFTITNQAAAVAYVEKATKNAIELFAKLCKFHNLDPLKDGVVISHAEGYGRGIASNHGDPNHLWKQLKMNYSMDKFRQDVNKELQRLIDAEKPAQSTQNTTTSSTSTVSAAELAAFKQLFREMRKEYQDNDAGTWSKEARDWAVKKELVKGSSDGSFNGAWEDFLTREQLIVILHRFAKMIGKD